MFTLPFLSGHPVANLNRINLYLNIVGHTCVLFKEISREGNREKDEQRGMDREIAKNGQWRVSKERIEK